MGRYYNGDIEGKFWFGIQSSNDADFFGSEGYQTYLQYYFDRSHLKSIFRGIKECRENLLENEQKLDEFFSKNNSYNEKMIEEQTGIKEKDCNKILKWYARLELGKKILKCVEENGECQFNAEI